MKQDNYKTEVKFLWEQPEADFKGNVFAFFPKEKYDDSATNLFMSYAHIGQHGACQLNYANECLPAKESDYLPLKQELESIGYNLKIID